MAAIVFERINSYIFFLILIQNYFNACTILCHFDK